MKQFSEKIQKKFDEMSKTGKLFRIELTGQQVWDLYLNSFTPEQNPVFRDPSSSTYNCNHCKNFIRRYGNIVSVNDNYEIETLFDVDGGEEYANTVKVLTEAIKKSKIKNVFFETFDELNSLPYEVCKKTNSKFLLGVVDNTKRYTKEEAEVYGVVKANQIVKFEHIHLHLRKDYVDMSGKSVEAIMGEFSQAKDVFIRGMQTIPLDTLNLVEDLITQGSLLDGATHLYKIQEIVPLKIEYDSLSEKQKDNWAWVKSYKLPYAKFRNELIGTLCTELAEGKELNDACQTWNKRVDPANYMKATAPITKKQIEDAKKFVEENGYEESFRRRYATLEDIKIDEILHANAGDTSIPSVSMFDSVKTTNTRHKRNEFDGIEEVAIDKFMKDILPKCSSVEAYLTNNQEGNMVTLTTAENQDSKPIFKWGNNYSWTFNGDLAGKSLLTERVEAKGGRTDGVFRFTHSWNELERNESLMDLHVFMPECKVPMSGGGPNVTGRRVGWNNRTDNLSGGTQDVDYTLQAPIGHIPVENITFPSLNKMPEGVYTCKIHNWSFRNSGGKGRAEIAFQGNIFEYIYPKTKQNEWITIAEVTLKNEIFSIEHKLPLSNSIAKEVYGLQTNEFHKVDLVCLSPNHWGKNKVGNKHYLFMLHGCKNPNSVRSFHNENLLPELATHRKVLEVLGATNKIKGTGKQLSGLGFNATISESLILRLSGSHKRTIKVNFGHA